MSAPLPPALPRVEPLDYAALAQGHGAAADELERQVAQLARWLGIVGEGLGRVLDDGAGELGFELGSGEQGVEAGLEGDEARRVVPVGA